MSEFKNFTNKVNENFKNLSKNNLFTVSADQDIFQVYLNAFPEGTNEIYRVRTWHDSSIDKNFIRKIGMVVNIVNNQVKTIWDNYDEFEYPYNIVGQKLSEFVKSNSIQNVFRTKEFKIGTATTKELLDDKSVHTWYHFHSGNIDRKFVTNQVGKILGEFDSVHSVFQRGLDELKLSDLQTVKELIQENMIYRGQEHLKSVEKFIELKTKYNTLNDKSYFAWENINNPIARFKNTVIGTLISDLSNGIELETAVKKFESKVAPHNYKRPKSLITPKMVEQAMETIKENDLESALERRHAKLSDISVNNVLFVDNSVQGQMKDGIEGLLMDQTSKPSKTVKNPTKISINEFMQDVLPKSKSIDVLLKNNHMGNFVSLTAPVNDEVQPLFKWDNNFAWSYDGNVTDSIKEKVKRAGGNVDCNMRVSLEWFNHDDLDIHCTDPDGTHIYFGNIKGVLDVDMNAGHVVDNPVENLQWSKNMKDGVYKIYVNNYKSRQMTNVGFNIEIENQGVIHNYSYSKKVGESKNINCFNITVKNNTIVKIDVLDKELVGGSHSQDKWNIKTEEFVSVNSIMFSPNHWDENETGNKHWFFILEGCKNSEIVRGIYNEFLRNDLEKHRKVFEILGDKTKCPYSDEQLSGVGFSSTKKEKLIVRVDNRPYEINFN